MLLGLQGVLQKVRWRGIFHWKFSGVLAPFFAAAGLAMLGLGASLDALDWAFTAAYILFTAALIWFLGCWLTSDFLQKRNPSNWNRARRRGKDLKSARRTMLTWKYGGGAAMTVLFGGCLLATHAAKTAKELSRLGGLLYPASDPEPEGACQLSGNQMGIYLGNMKVVAERFPLAVIKVAEKPAVVLDRNQDGSLNLSLDIKSDDGRIIVRLDKNVYIVNPNNYLSMKRPDRSSLRVTDQYGVEVLRARYLNRWAFRLSAKLAWDGHVVDTDQIPISGICLKIEHGPEGAGALGFR